MNHEPVIVLTVLGIALILFAWNRWRYDVVALSVLLVLALAGLVPADQVFSGFGHPAVITVAAVLVISRGLVNAGVVDALARRLTRIGKRPTLQVLTLTAMVALCSGFMNNIGALALLMPVGIWMARRSGRSPSFLLMPLAFGSLLGGTLTLIGTPPNIIIAMYRGQHAAAPFGMFDFLPVGLAITLAGVAFIAVVGWRLIPRPSTNHPAAELFELSAYLTEVRVPEGCAFAGQALHDLIATIKDDADFAVLALIREKKRIDMPSTYTVLREQDNLVIQASPDGINALLDATGLKLAAEADRAADPAAAPQNKLAVVEAIVAPGSMLVGSTLSRLDLRERHGINVLAVARQGERIRAQLGKIRFVAGDIMLLQGHEEQVESKLNVLGCLPLVSRGIRIGKPRKLLTATTIFAAALVLIVLDLAPAAVALSAAAVAMVIAGLLSSRDAYRGIDLSVIVLLAALLPVGQTLETNGGAEILAGLLLRLTRNLPQAATVAVLMGGVMLLSNIINNAAAAVLAAPVAVTLSRSMGVSADPLLMAVAIGASTAFLTPIGHQSNALVMIPGGYRFGDYWRMGLPLTLLVIGVAVPVILRFWPLA